MNITIYGKPEPEALGKAVERAVRFMGDDLAGSVRIQCGDRRQQGPYSGQLEYFLTFTHPEDDRSFLICMLQRQYGEEFEFHS